MTTSTHRYGRDLLSLASAVLQPGFVGTSPPDWVRRRLADGLGGLALFSRNIRSAEQVAELTSALRAENPDVIIAIDEEAGDVTRLEAATGSTRPGNLALGVVDDVAVTEAIGREVGNDLAERGITLDYAPSVDVNSNPDNPVIGVRSFGADPDLVARHGAAWIRGLQSAGVAACAKHFPGHGDTSVDSHLATPVVTATPEELAAIALPPFQAAIAAGTRAIMTAHLVVPAMDPDTPATMSRRVLIDLLRAELGFDGLIVTDGIEMRGVSDRYGLAGATVHAITAGADAICVGGGFADEATADELRDALAEAVVAGTLPEARLANAARRVGDLADWLAARAGDRAAPVRTEPVGLAAARRAIRVRTRASAALPLRGAPHVVELSPTVSIAVDGHTPWGVAGPLTELMPDTTSVTITGSEATEAVLAERGLRPAAGRPLIIVTRDARRHAWMAEALRYLVSARADAGVVEMGIPGRTDTGAFHLDTHGATLASGMAAADLLANG